jgi:hypothetical protein
VSDVVYTAEELLKWIADVYEANKLRGYPESKCRGRACSRNFLTALYAHLNRKMPATVVQANSHTNELWKE